MKLAVLAIAVLALTGCKTTSINGQHITDYGDGVEIPERGTAKRGDEAILPESPKLLDEDKHSSWPRL